jgi:hypothetical protein
VLDMACCFLKLTASPHVALTAGPGAKAAGATAASSRAKAAGATAASARAKAAGEHCELQGVGEYREPLGHAVSISAGIALARPPLVRRIPMDCDHDGLLLVPVPELFGGMSRHESREAIRQYYLSGPGRGWLFPAEPPAEEDGRCDEEDQAYDLEDVFRAMDVAEGRSGGGSGARAGKRQAGGSLEEDDDEDDEDEEEQDEDEEDDEAAGAGDDADDEDEEDATRGEDEGEEDDEAEDEEEEVEEEHEDGEDDEADEDDEAPDDELEDDDEDDDPGSD